MTGVSSRRRVVRVHPSALHRELQGEGVLLQLDLGEYFGLDEVGERIWQLLVEHGDLAVVERVIAEEYAIDAERAAADLQRLIGELAANQLIEIADAEA